jgi:hypothetical protein
MKKILMTGFIIYTSFASAETKTYDYSVDMRESDGTVQHMGDVRVNVTQEGSYMQESNTNAQLLNSIQDYIKNSYREYNINIHIQDGVVTLQGLVKSDSDKKSIENAVMQFDGVKKVENKLQVGSLKTPVE